MGWGGWQGGHIPETAALLTSRCISGWSFCSHLAKLLTEAMELMSTSPSTTRPFPLAATWISVKACSPAARFRQARITQAPRRASAWATAFPMPVEGRGTPLRLGLGGARERDRDRQHRAMSLLGAQGGLTTVGPSHHSSLPSQICRAEMKVPGPPVPAPQAQTEHRV